MKDLLILVFASGPSSLVGLPVAIVSGSVHVGNVHHPKNERNWDNIVPHRTLLHTWNTIVTCCHLLEMRALVESADYDFQRRYPFHSSLSTERI